MLLYTCVDLHTRHEQVTAQAKHDTGRDRFRSLMSTSDQLDQNPGPLQPQRNDGGQASQGDGAWRRHRTVFTNAKAGMEGVDKEHVQKVVYEMSKVCFRAPSIPWISVN